tara:strand:- start:62 stop:427 length:366 start_codon:yes stop_codon:yes gene_type:complete
MDILDTTGDWIELILSAFILFYFTIKIFGLLIGILMKRETPQLQVVFALIISSILWTQVYDYDLILGYLIGSVALVVYSFKKVRFYLDHNNSIQENKYIGTLLTGCIVFIVMVLKIVFFFE